MKYTWIKHAGRRLYLPAALANQDGYVYLPHRRKAFASNMSWATWDGETESGWGNSEHAFVIMGDGSGSSNEIGQGGGLSEANRTWTQNGSIAGSGSYRTLDGGDDFFSVTTGFRDFLAGATVYGLCFKLEDWAPDTDYESIIHWAASDLIYRVVTGGGYPLQGFVGGTQIGAANTTDSLTTSGVIYCYLGCNGSDTMVGFTSSGSGLGGQPTKMSDFVWTKRVLHGSALAMPVMSEGAPDIFRSSEGNNRYVGAKFYWAVFCNNDPLIDFSS